MTLEEYWVGVEARAAVVADRDESEGAKSARRAHEYLWGESGYLGCSPQQTQNGARNAAAQNVWNQYANAAYGISDTGDETSPSESNPVPIEDVYAPEEKIESEEERRERLWKAVQVSSIT